MTAHAPRRGGNDVVAIRDMAKDDLAEVLRIEGSSFPSPWTEGMFLEEMSSSLCVSRVALCGGAVIGYSSFSLVLDEAHLRNIAVESSRRCRGVASELLADMISISLGRGARRASLEVRPSNSRAVGLYYRFGFHVAGLRPQYYADTREDALIMWADLSGSSRGATQGRAGVDEAGQGT